MYYGQTICPAIYFGFNFQLCEGALYLTGNQEWRLSIAGPRIKIAPTVNQESRQGGVPSSGSCMKGAVPVLAVHSCCMGAVGRNQSLNAIEIQIRIVDGLVDEGNGRRHCSWTSECAGFQSFT